MDSQQNSTVFHRRSINNPFKLFKEIKKNRSRKNNPNFLLWRLYDSNIKISKDTTKKYSPISLMNTGAKFLKAILTNWKWEYTKNDNLSWSNWLLCDTDMFKHITIKIVLNHRYGHKYKNYISFSINAKKSFDNTQHDFMIKVPQNIVLYEIYCN